MPTPTKTAAQDQGSLARVTRSPSNPTYVQRKQNFGVALGSLRKANGWSQDYLASQVGVSQASIASWEKGTNAPDPEVVFKMERVLGAKPGSLSRSLGFIPADSGEARERMKTSSVTEAVMADRGLDDIGKKLVIKVYSTLRSR